MNNVIKRSRNLQPENLKKELKLQFNLPAAHLLKGDNFNWIVMVERVFAKNERWYRLTAKNDRFWSLL